MDGKSIRNKLIGSDDERAVSPVIGVILMVAITVILAAVIAAFVLDMGSGQSSNAEAGLDIQENSSHSNLQDVTVTSMGDNTKAVYCGDSSSNSTTEVGGTFQCSNGSNIVGNTSDGGENVLSTDIGA